MPTSNPFAISEILRRVIDLAPKSILDIGMGFGKWGVLFREMLDVWNWRIEPSEWKVRIDGIEGYKKYHNPIHDFVYNDVLFEDVRKIDWVTVSSYDLICIFDVIEHLPKVDGYSLLSKLISITNRAIYVTTPLPEDFSPSRHGKHGDDLEGHVEAWTPEEFVDHFNAKIVKFDSGRRGYRTYLAMIVRGDV